MSDYYVDMDQVASGSGTDVDPWNLTDVIAPNFRSLVDGDIVYIKGKGDTIYGLDFDVASYLTDTVTFLPWPDEMSAFCINSGLYYFTNPVTYRLGAHVTKRMISSGSQIGYAILLESCIYITQQNIGIMRFGHAPSGNLTITIKGCTFKTADKAIVVSDYQGGTPNVTTVNFTSCLFINTIFDGFNFGYTENEVINCYNCTFIGKSEAEVKAGFETHSGTITFDANCRFSESFPVGAPTFPANISELLNDSAKLALRFSAYDDGTTTLRGPVGYDYSSDGVGIFGGERRGVGAWWFDNEYYVDLSKTVDTGNGNGLSKANAMGTDTLKLFVTGTAVDGRYIREDDTLRLFNSWNMASGDTFVLPTALQTLGTYKSDPSTNAYLGIKVKPIDDDDPFKIITASAIADVPFNTGSYNFIERMITDSLYLCYNTEQVDMKTCLFINSTKVNIDLSLLKNSYIKGCTFLTPEINFKETTSSFLNFDQCLFAEYDDVPCVPIGGSIASIWGSKYPDYVPQIEFAYDVYIGGSKVAVRLEATSKFFEQFPGVSIKPTWGSAPWYMWSFKGLPATQYPPPNSRFGFTDNVAYDGNTYDFYHGETGNRVFLEILSDPTGTFAYVKLIAVESGTNNQGDSFAIIKYDEHAPTPYLISDFKTKSFKLELSGNQARMLYDGNAVVTPQTDGSGWVTYTTTGADFRPAVPLASQTFWAQLDDNYDEITSELTISDVPFNNGDQTYVPIPSISNNIHVNITNSRFIATQAAILAGAGVTLDTNTTYENILGRDFIETIGDIDAANLRFSQYNVFDNLVVTGSSYIGFDFGLWDNARLGVGAFFFPSYTPHSIYYFNVGASVQGAGTSIENPWDLDQLIAYLDGTSATAAVDGDVLKGYGSASITTADLFSVDIFDISKTITLEAYNMADPAYGPIIFEVDSSLSGNDVNIFHFLGGTEIEYPTVLNIKDFVILAPTGSANSLNIVESDSGYTELNIYMTLIISDVPTFMIQTGDNYTEIYSYGSTVSIGANGSFRYGTEIGSNNFYDCVFNINNAASITMTGASILDHCETNRTEADMAATSTVLSTFEKTGITALPETLLAADFDIQLFVYKLFDVINTGHGSSYWNANSFNYGFGGTTRAGIGAFYFIDRELYADGNSTISGNGSETAPFTYAQLRNYFNPDVGVDCTTWPVNGDVVNIKGVFTSTIVKKAFDIKRNVPGSIKLKAWTIETNGLWILENTGELEGMFDIFSSNEGFNINNIIIKDCLMIQIAENYTVMRISDIVPDVGESSVLDIKNCLMYAKGSLSFETNTRCTSNYYGFTAICDKIYMTEGGGNFNLNDGVVKANTLIH